MSSLNANDAPTKEDESMKEDTTRGQELGGTPPKKKRRVSISSAGDASQEDVAKNTIDDKTLQDDEPHQHRIFLVQFE